MNSLIKKLSTRPVPNGCKNTTKPWKYTEQNLAVTPSEIMELTNRGIPVSPSNANQFVVGVPNPSYDLPVDQRRGVDIVDVWDASQSAKRSLIQANIKDTETYG